MLRGERWRLSWAHHRAFLILGFWTALNGILVQFGIPFVSEELTNVLIQFSVPTTWIVAWVFLRFEVDVFRMLSAGVIFGSLLLAVVPSLFWGSGAGNDDDNPPFWVIIVFLRCVYIYIAMLVDWRVYICTYCECHSVCGSR